MNRNSQCPQVEKLPEYVLWEIPKLIAVQTPKKEETRISRTRFISSIDNPVQRSFLISQLARISQCNPSITNIMSYFRSSDRVKISNAVCTTMKE